MVYPYKGIFNKYLKEWIHTSSKMETYESQNNYAKWKKPDKKKHTIWFHSHKTLQNAEWKPIGGFLGRSQREGHCDTLRDDGYVNCGMHVLHKVWKLIKLYTLSMFSLFYVNYISTKLLTKANISYLRKDDTALKKKKRFLLDYVHQNKKVSFKVE